MAVKRATTYMATVPVGEAEEEVFSANPPVNGFCAGAESFCGLDWTGFVTFASHAPLEPWGLRILIGIGVMVKYSCECRY